MTQNTEQYNTNTQLGQQSQQLYEGSDPNNYVRPADPEYCKWRQRPQNIRDLNSLARIILRMSPIYRRSGKNRIAQAQNVTSILWKR